MLKKSKGQSLLEVLIALSVIILVLTALVKVVTMSIRSTDYARNSSVATTYATEAMEKIRSFRDANPWIGNFATLPNSTKLANDVNYANLKSNSTTNCPDPVLDTTFTTPLYSASLLEGIYLRCVTFLTSGSPVTSVKVTVSVYWMESDITPKKAEIVSYFYNWK